VTTKRDKDKDNGKDNNKDPGLKPLDFLWSFVRGAKAPR
jgi:hypothetical protein